MLELILVVILYEQCNVQVVPSSAMYSEAAVAEYFVLESSSKIDMLTICCRSVWSYAFTFLAGPALVVVKQKDNIFVTAYFF